MANNVFWEILFHRVTHHVSHTTCCYPCTNRDCGKLIVASPDVRKGELPPLPTGSKIKIPLPKLCQVKATIIDKTMLPDKMKDGSAPIWKDDSLLQKKIKEILPLGAKTKNSQRVPQCLILDALILLELLIVLNCWWLTLSHDQKKEEFKLLRGTYMRPIKSNERMPSPSKVVLATDRQEVLDEHTRNSASARGLGVGKRKHCTQKDDLDGARQVMAKPICALAAKVQKSCQDLMDETVELPLSVSFQCSMILKGMLLHQERKARLLKMS
jgi:hypothetical protein